MTTTLVPREQFSPANREALAEFLRHRAESPLYDMRPVGSMTSKSPCFETTGTELSLDTLDHIERVSEYRVRVGAGVILRTLLNFLTENDLALPTIGEWSGQTMGGAISTGTHGGSYRYGSLCDSVHSVTFLDAFGQMRTVRRDEPDFKHLLPSFGTTGIALEYELDVEAMFGVALGRRCLSFYEYLDELLTNPQTFDFRGSIWMPARGFVLDYAGHRILECPTGFETDREVRFNDTAMVLDWVSKNVGTLPRPVRWLAKSLGMVAQGPTNPQRLFPDRQYLGHYDHMLAPLRGTAKEILKKRARNRTPPEGEFAIPVNRASLFINALNDLFQTTGYYPDRPVGLRPGIQESGSLSPTQEGPSIWVSMFIYEDNPLMKVLPSMLVEHGTRPHWGKCVFHRPDQVAALYPQWDSFCRFRNEVDPLGVFLNPFARSFGMRA